MSISQTYESKTPDALITGCIYALTGARPGPALKVIGSSAVIQRAAANLARMPSLVYLRGSLELGTDLSEGSVDDVLDLSHYDDGQNGFEPNDAHWIILARAASLGMISGRGIPRHLITAAGVAA